MILKFMRINPVGIVDPDVADATTRVHVARIVGTVRVRRNAPVGIADIAAEAVDATTRGHDQCVVGTTCERRITCSRRSYARRN